MGINHSNLYKKIITLVQGRYGLLHAEVNGTEVGDGGVTASESGRSGRDRTGEVIMGGRRQSRGAGIRREGQRKYRHF